MELIKTHFRLGIHLRQCKTARGVTIPKPGKDDYGLAKSYRVISLLNCLGKMVEKVATIMVSTHYEATGPPPWTVRVLHMTIGCGSSWGHHRTDPVGLEPRLPYRCPPDGRRRRLLQRGQRIPERQVGGHSVRFAPAATRWLGIWLDPKLSLTENRKRWIAKTRQAGERLRRIANKYGVPPAAARNLLISTF